MTETVKKPTDTEGLGGDKQATIDNSKTFSQEQVDNIVKERLERSMRKNQEAIAQARQEWERQASLTAEEKAKEESQKRTQELEQREREVAIAKSELEATKLLADSGIDTGLTKYLITEDIEATKGNVKEFKEVFNQAVEKMAIEKAKLVGKTPTDNASSANVSSADTRRIIAI